MKTSVARFDIHVPDQLLSDLQTRLGRTRWIHESATDSWSAGTNPSYLRALVQHWQSEYQWREHEAALNRLANFTANIDGNALHFLHERGVGADAIPIVLTHGYPDSYLRFRKLIPLLTNPTAHGGDERDVFDVVVPSLPGFGFSTVSNEHAGIFDVGAMWHKLMTEALGYERYAAHGGDWGSLVTEQLARDHRDSLIGIHLTDVPFWHAFQRPDNLTGVEEKFLDDNKATQQREGAYAVLQGTRPQTLADALSDSPAGMTAWLVEKFQSLSDCGGNIENRFTKDELITNVMLYWVNASIGTSFLPYYDMTHAGAARWIQEKAKTWLGSSHVPAAFALFPKDLTHTPRKWAERFFNVERWTEMPRGGHFTALEEPELLAHDIREFFRPFRVQHPAV
ncbi:MAG: epoxide hydrolase family protein [Gemmatimonadaceae bacterium]